MKRFIFFALAVVLVAALFLGGCSQDDQGHVHGDDPYEWSAVYNLPRGTYTLEFQESENDPSILVAFLLEVEDEHALYHLAYHVMEAVGEDVAAGGSFTAQDQYAYNLILDPAGTTFTFEIKDPGVYVIFTEHFAWEFDMKVYDSNGVEIPGENSIDHAEPHDH
jgi:hypothetical protein